MMFDSLLLITWKINLLLLLLLLLLTTQTSILKYHPCHQQPQPTTPTPTTPTNTARPKGQGTKKGKVSSTKKAKKEKEDKNQRKLTDFMVRPKPPPPKPSPPQGLMTNLKQQETIKGSTVQSKVKEFTRKFSIPPKPTNGPSLPPPPKFNNKLSEPTPLLWNERRPGQQVTGNKSISCQRDENTTKGNK